MYKNKELDRPSGADWGGQASVNCKLGAMWVNRIGQNFWDILLSSTCEPDWEVMTLSLWSLRGFKVLLWLPFYQLFDFS